MHWHAKRFETPEAAHAALAALANGWLYHQVEADTRIAHTRDGHQGRPTSTTPSKALAWQMPAQVRPDTETLEPRKPHQACLGLGTNIAARPWHAADVMAADNGQAQAEGGVRFRTDPRFFVASLWVQKPSRIQGLLMVMTLA